MAAGQDTVPAFISTLQFRRRLAMKFIGDRWLSSLLIGAALTLVVGVVMTATAPVACAPEEEGTESTPAAEEPAAAESSDSYCPAE